MIKVIIILTLFFSFCKQTKIQLTSEELKSIHAIFNENQKIYEFLLNNETQLPSIHSLQSTLEKAKSTSHNSELIQIISNLQNTLIPYNQTDREKAFLALSNFANELDKLAVFADLKEYHKFFCPMVSKYWVAKGELIQNPYAPDMRECGDLVR